MRARRLPVVDEYVDGDQMAVFVGGQVVVLSAVASATLLAVSPKWTQLATITPVVVAIMGPPPEGSAEDAVAAVLSQLRDLGLVELRP